MHRRSSLVSGFVEARGIAQRQAAREQYKTLKTLPPEKKQEVRLKWEQYQNLPPETKRELAARPPTPASTAPLKTRNAPSLAPTAPPDAADPKRRLTPAAQRALAEAAARRSSEIASRPRELHGRKGPDPVRYGDWEVNGRVSDF